jgi:RND family efflux transporter MFP subunit
MRFLWIIIFNLLLPASLLAQTAINVRVQDLSEVLIDFERRAPADVRALNDSTFSAEVSAIVLSVHADVGQAVQKGDLLLQLDPADYQLNLNQAEANLVSSKAVLGQANVRLKRARSLSKSQHISADELLERETDEMVSSAKIRANEVAVSIARRNLEKSSIEAPYDGVVGERMAQLGSFVRNGDPLITVTQIDRFELNAELPDGMADGISSADMIRFESRGESWPVELLRLSPVIDSQRRTRLARFAFSDNAPAIGRSGELVWRTDQGMLPSNLISRRNGILGVFVLDSDHARFAPLAGAQEGRPAEVNLPASSRIITMGRERLQDGMTVSVQ